LQRNYVERAGDGSLNITLRGRAVLEFLLERYPSLFSVEFTAKMEAMLDGIASKRVSYGQVVGQLYQALS
jgi:DNA topoisomerase IA